MSIPDAQTETPARPAGVSEVPVVEIQYFTDPLCSWSWAFEAAWRRLRYEYGRRVCWRYRMGGMISSWQNYADPLNSVNRPAQMGPLWYQVRHMTGMPLDDLIWLEDPPSSSYPACIAVKAAEMQSAEAGELYLRRLREAVMTERRNIARSEVLETLARELAQREPARFCADRFLQDLASTEAVEAFRTDVREARYLEIGRFPTLIFQTPGRPSLLMTGYRPYPVLCEALRHLAPDLQPERPSWTADEFTTYWKNVLPQELARAQNSS